MERYIRGDKRPVPFNLRKHLNEEQLLAVQILKQLGWSIYFVRRPRFEKSTVVMVDENRKHYGLLMSDGDLNTNLHIPMRLETH